MLYFKIGDRSVPVHPVFLICMPPFKRFLSGGWSSPTTPTAASLSPPSPPSEKYVDQTKNHHTVAFILRTPFQDLRVRFNLRRSWFCDDSSLLSWMLFLNIEFGGWIWHVLIKNGWSLRAFRMRVCTGQEFKFRSYLTILVLIECHVTTVVCFRNQLAPSFCKTQ